MPRDQVYQLRLTKDEKDELGRRAREQGISIAKLIRQRLSLDSTQKTWGGKPPAKVTWEEGKTYAESEWKKHVPLR